MGNDHQVSKVIASHRSFLGKQRLIGSKGRTHEDFSEVKDLSEVKTHQVRRPQREEQAVSIAVPTVPFAPCPAYWSSLPHPLVAAVMASRRTNLNVAFDTRSDSIHPVITHLHWLSSTIAADTAMELDKPAGND